MQTYKIIRFYKDERENRVMARGLTLAAAQAHCNAISTKGNDWFDGYEKE